MRGSIVTRTLTNGKKSYAAVYRVVVDGKRKQKWRWFSKQKDAARHLASTVTTVHAGTYREIRPLLFKTFAAAWAQGLSDIKPSTAEKYRSTIRSALVPNFGDLPLSEIGPDVVNAWLARRADAGIKPKTSRNQLAILTKMLNDARETHQVAVNRLAGSRALRRPRALRASDETVVEVFDPEEINALLDAIEPAYTVMVLAWVSMGVRPGELFAMRWGDVDWTRKTITVARTLYKGEDLVVKTRSSRRTVDVGDQLLASLSGLRRDRFGEGPVDLEAPIFWTPAGERLDPNHFRKGPWMRALVKAGLRYRKPYSLRHTFATLLLSQGQTPSYVASQLGHSSPVMTLNVYAKWLPRERREAPARVEAQLAAARKPSALTPC